MSDETTTLAAAPEVLLVEPPVNNTEVDNTELILASWGLSGEPMSWAQTVMQPVIITIRHTNTGFGSAEAVQEMLDATWPDGGYLAANVMLAHPPVGLFTATVTADSVRVDLAGDADLGLPDANVTWDFGDGSDMVHDAGGWDHTYASPGTYPVRLTIMVAGTAYGESQEITVGTAAPTVDSLEPNEAVCGGPDITMRVHGSGFDESTVIVFNGGDEPTTLWSDTIVQTGVKPSLATITITVPVAVRNGDVLSNALGFSFLGGAAATVTQPEPPVAETPVEPEATPAVETPVEPDPEPAPVEPEPAPAEAYDPGVHTVDEVLAYADAHPDEVGAIIAAEEAGKNRSTLLDKL